MRTPRAYGTLKDPTALPQCPHSELSNMICKCQAVAFVLSMFKINAAAQRFKRLHSLYTALLATAQCTPWQSSTFFNAVEML